MKVRRTTHAELTDPPVSEARRRDDQFCRALDLAATSPASVAIVIEPTGDERIATIRTALANFLRAEPPDLNWGVRGDRIIITKGELPPRR